MISWKIQRGDKVTKFPAGAVREHFGDVTVILCAGLHWQLHAWFTWGLLPSLSVRRLTPCRSHSHCCYYYTHTPLSIWLAARRHVFPQRKSGRQLRDANTYQKHSHLHLRGRRLATAEERVSARLSHRASCLAPLRFARTAAAGSTDQPVRESLRPGGVKEDGPTDGWTAGCVLLSPYPPVRYASLRFRCPLLPPLPSSDSARGLVGTR